VALVLVVGDPWQRPLALLAAGTLLALQIAYLGLREPSARGWTAIAVLVPATAGVAMVAMSEGQQALLPLLIAPVCWYALLMTRHQVLASVGASIAVSAVPLASELLGVDGIPVGVGVAVGLFAGSAIGFALVAGVAFGVQSARISAGAARRGLERERDRSAAILRALRDGVVHCAPGGRIVGVNEVVCAMTGFTEQELVGAMPPLPYWPEEELGAIRAFATASSTAARASTS
jgi:PAS domain-containing protein